VLAKGRRGYVMNNNLADKTRDLLIDVAPILERAKKGRCKQALDFNVFEAAAISRREVYHSAFLAALLDPSGSHGQGTLFLRSFLSCLHIEATENALKCATVHTEYPIDDGRRLDILVELPGEALVAIENKIDAGEQQDQLSDYRRWLVKEGKQLQSYLIFLTPDGRPPFSGNGLLLSYVKLAEWLNRTLESCEAPRVRVVVNQYAELCAKLGDVVMDRYDDEVMKLLVQPEHRELVIELAPYFEALCRRVAMDFWKNVQQELIRRLAENGIDHRWAANIESETRSNDKALMLRPKGSAPGAVYGVGINLWHGGSFLTVERPRKRSREIPPNDGAIVSALRERRYIDKESEPGFCGWRNTKEMDLPDFGSNENSVLQYQLRDNTASELGHPEAKKVASKIFDLFLVCREELERLNQKLS
jgi:hypothetical protein